MTRRLSLPVAILVSCIASLSACPVSAGQEGRVLPSDVRAQKGRLLVGEIGIETGWPWKEVRIPAPRTTPDNRKQPEILAQNTQSGAMQGSQPVQVAGGEGPEPGDPYDSREAQKKAEAALLRTGPTGPGIVPIVSSTEPVVASFDTIIGRESHIRDEGGGLQADVISLDRAISDLDAKVTTTAIIVNLQSDILFDFDKATLKPAAKQALARVALIIREKGTGKVHIDGHTDSIGSEAYNQKLSERRANAVKSWLVSHEGVPEDLLVARGFGETRPVAPNTLDDGTDNPEGRARNRRVVITIPTAE